MPKIFREKVREKDKIGLPKPLGVSISIYGACRPVAVAGSITHAGAALLRQTVQPRRDLVERPFHCPLADCRESRAYHLKGGFEHPTDLLAHLHYEHFLMRYHRIPRATLSEDIVVSSRFTLWTTPDWYREDTCPDYLGPNASDVLVCSICDEPRSGFSTYWELFFHHCCEHLKLPPDQWLTPLPPTLSEDTKDDVRTLDPTLLPIKVVRDNLSLTRGQLTQEDLDEIGRPLLCPDNLQCFYPTKGRRYGCRSDRSGFRTHLKSHERVCSICFYSDTEAIFRSNCQYMWRKGRSDIDSDWQPPPTFQEYRLAGESDVVKDNRQVDIHRQHYHPDPAKLRSIVRNILTKAGAMHPTRIEALLNCIPGVEGWGGISILDDTPFEALSIAHLPQEIKDCIDWPHFFICPKPKCLDYHRRRLKCKHRSLKNVQASPKKTHHCPIQGCSFTTYNLTVYDKHVKKSCPLLRVCCPHCSVIMTKRARQLHQKKCSLAAIGLRTPMI